MCYIGAPFVILRDCRERRICIVRLKEKYYRTLTLAHDKFSEEYVHGALNKCIAKLIGFHTSRFFSRSSLRMIYCWLYAKKPVEGVSSVEICRIRFQA